MNKNEWLLDFTTELLVNLRPGMAARFAKAAAALEWAKGRELAPRAAAKRWCDDHLVGSPEREITRDAAE